MHTQVLAFHNLMDSSFDAVNNKLSSTAWKQQSFMALP